MESELNVWTISCRYNIYFSVRSVCVNSRLLTMLFFSDFFVLYSYKWRLFIRTCNHVTCEWKAFWKRDRGCAAADDNDDLEFCLLIVQVQYPGPHLQNQYFFDETRWGFPMMHQASANRKWWDEFAIFFNRRSYVYVKSPH